MLDEVAASKALIDSVNEKLTHPGTPSGRNITVNKTISKRASITMNLPAGAHAVRLLSMQLDDIGSEADKLMVRIKFDGHQTVYCPLGDFEGSGKGGKPINSWYRTDR